MKRMITRKAPPYLITNISRILNCSQELAPIPLAYDKFTKNPHVKSIIEESCSKRNLQRKEVLKLYKGPNLVTALVGTMIWGLSNTRYGHFQRMLAVKEVELELRMHKVKRLVKANKIREAFTSMQYGQPNQIAGIGYAYFTKIFYFLGQLFPKLNPKPLIFDKWTQNGYCALLSQVDQKKAAELFEIGSNGDAKPRHARLVDCYICYITDMHEWANELGQICKSFISSERLEMFIFGTSLRVDRSPTNPRQELRKILLSLKP
jgi:hypothetical protein